MKGALIDFSTDSFADINYNNFFVKLHLSRTMEYFECMQSHAMMCSSCIVLLGKCFAILGGLHLYFHQSQILLLHLESLR